MAMITSQSPEIQPLLTPMAPHDEPELAVIGHRLREANKAVRARSLRRVSGTKNSATFNSHRHYQQRHSQGLQVRQAQLTR
jgi:hypothetical protein